MRRALRILVAASVAAAASAAPSARAEAPPTLQLPEPALLARTQVAPAEPGPEYYRLPPSDRWLATRVAVGGGVRASGPFAYDGAFALDLGLSARIGLGRRREFGWALMPDFGYANLALGAPSRSHSFLAGVGLGLLNGGTAFGVVPRFVVGNEAGRSALGLRTGVVIDGVFEPGVLLEIAHTVTWQDTSAAHDVRLLVGLDPTLFFTPRRCHLGIAGRSTGGCDR